VPAKRPLGRLAEVEDVLGDLAHALAPIQRPMFLLELGVIDGLHDPVDLELQLVARRSGLRSGGGDDAEGEHERDGHEE